MWKAMELVSNYFLWKLILQSGSRPEREYRGTQLLWLLLWKAPLMSKEKGHTKQFHPEIFRVPKTQPVSQALCPGTVPFVSPVGVRSSGDCIPQHNFSQLNENGRKKKKKCVVTAMATSRRSNIAKSTLKIRIEVTMYYCSS